MGRNGLKEVFIAFLGCGEGRGGGREGWEGGRKEGKGGKEE